MLRNIRIEYLKGIKKIKFLVRRVTISKIKRNEIKDTILIVQLKSRWKH